MARWGSMPRMARPNQSSARSWQKFWRRIGRHARHMRGRLVPPACQPARLQNAFQFLARLGVGLGVGLTKSFVGSQVTRGRLITFFPRSMMRPPIDGATAVALSGGGSRAYVAALGQLEALRALSLIDNVDHVAGVSGGAWAAVVDSWLTEQTTTRPVSR